MKDKGYPTLYFCGGGKGEQGALWETCIHTCFIYLESYTIKGISISIWDMHKWIIALHLASLWNRTLRQHRWWPKYRVKRDSAVHCLQNLGRLYSQLPCLLCSSEKKQATNKQKVKEWYFWKRRFPPSPRLSLPFTRKRCFGYQKHRYVHRNCLQNENGRKKRFLNTMMSYIIQRMPCMVCYRISIVLAFLCGRAIAKFYEEQFLRREIFDY